jgi:hypothetical protein
MNAGRVATREDFDAVARSMQGLFELDGPAIGTRALAPCRESLNRLDASACSLAPGFGWSDPEKEKPRHLDDSGVLFWCRRDESNTRPSHYE